MSGPTGKVRVDVYLRRNSDGVVRIHSEEDNLWGEPPRWNNYWWQDGNASCDCNRELFFTRAGGEKGGDYKCGDERFTIEKIVRVSDGEVLYTEEEENALRNPPAPSSSIEAHRTKVALEAATAEAHQRLKAVLATTENRSPSMVSLEGVDYPWVERPDGSFVIDMIQVSVLVTPVQDSSEWAVIVTTLVSEGQAGDIKSPQTYATADEAKTAAEGLVSHERLRVRELYSA